MGAKIRLNGNLGDNPKMGKTADGKPYITFSIYQPHWVRSDSKNENGQDKFDDVGGFWINVAWFSKKAENANNLLKKGSSVVVEGDLRVEYWEDKETGDERAAWKVIADDVCLDMRSVESVTYKKRENQNHNQPVPNIGSNQRVKNESSGNDQVHPSDEFPL